MYTSEICFTEKTKKSPLSFEAVVDIDHLVHIVASPHHQHGRNLQGFISIAQLLPKQQNVRKTCIYSCSQTIETHNKHVNSKTMIWPKNPPSPPERKRVQENHIIHNLYHTTAPLGLQSLEERREWRHTTYTRNSPLFCCQPLAQIALFRK
jgi:hypothetical protein